jgi:hypothetical protein
MATFTNPQCDPNVLLTQAKCFLPACIGPDDREAIEIYVRVAELAAVGGTDYRTNLAKLLVDAKGWQALVEDHRRAVTLWIDVLNATNNGATIATDINSLRTGSKCYLCLGWETKKALKLFLKCQLNKLDQPE